MNLRTYVIYVDNSHFDRNFSVPILDLYDTIHRKYEMCINYTEGKNDFVESFFFHHLLLVSSMKQEKK